METTFYRWNSRGVYVDSFTQLDTDAIPPNSTTTEPPEIPEGKVALWAGEWFIGEEPPIPEPIPDPVPEKVSMRQCRLELFAVGKLSMIAPAIASLPEPQRTVAQIEWEYAPMVERASMFVALLGQAIGYDSAGIDTLFRNAEKR